MLLEKFEAIEVFHIQKLTFRLSAPPPDLFDFLEQRAFRRQIFLKADRLGDQAPVVVFEDQIAKAFVWNRGNRIFFFFS